MHEVFFVNHEADEPAVVTLTTNVRIAVHDDYELSIYEWLHEPSANLDERLNVNIKLWIWKRSPNIEEILRKIYLFGLNFSTSIHGAEIHLIMKWINYNLLQSLISIFQQVNR